MESQPSLLAGLKAPFLRDGRLDRLALALFLAINGLVLVNSILHDPGIGYDAVDHLRYIRILPSRMPSEADTREFFSPPLPYFVPSLVDEACLARTGRVPMAGAQDDCLRLAGKAAQGLNFLISLGVTFLILKTGDTIRPGNRFWRVSALLLLGMMTVYYKTFAQVRGEPFVVLFTMWALYLMARIVTRPDRTTPQTAVGLGVILGLLGLSRQWGFMLFPAILGLMVLVWALDARHRARIVKALAASLAIAVVVCGWFYAGLFARYGTFTPFNRPARALALSNQPVAFYRNTGLKDLWLFRSPTRGTFDNQLLPTFYSEVWGDYWGYFVLIPERASLSDDRYSQNADGMTSYLGRANAAAVAPSLVLAAGVVTGLLSLPRRGRADGEDGGRSLFTALLVMFLGAASLLYLYFLIRFTSIAPDTTIKATFVLHGLLALPLLGAEFLERVRRRLPQAYIICLVVLVLVWIHNLPTMITHYRL
jgi:hypothetical protein